MKRETTLLKSVLEKYKNPYFVETGTASGEAVKLALELGFEKVFSIEVDKQLYQQNVDLFKKFVDDGRLMLLCGDSAAELNKIIPLLDTPTTFWLDAHNDMGLKDVKLCPLYEELDIINASKIHTHTILIDDMRLIGKHGWGKHIDFSMLKNKLMMINENYNFKFEPNTVNNQDVLVAHVN